MEGEKIKLSFGAKPVPPKSESASTPAGDSKSPQSGSPPLTSADASDSSKKSEENASAEQGESAKTPAA